MEEVLPHFIEAFKNLVQFNCSKEVMRHLALFVTYALHPTSSVSRTPKSFSAISRSSTPAVGISRKPTLEANEQGPSAGPRLLSKKQTGVKLLEMYSDVLCEPGDRVRIERFAQTVTNRVSAPLLRMSDSN